MSERTEYAVFRFLDQNGYCHKISDVIIGRSIMQYVKDEIPVTRQCFFGWSARLAYQMEQYCKCRDGQIYGYLNPYAVIVADENEILLIDVADSENEELIRKMQKKKIRSLFVRKDHILSQKMSEEDDLYGYGKTIQFMMAKCCMEDKFTGKEERTVRRILEKCLNGKKTGKDVWREIRREFGNLEKASVSEKRIYVNQWRANRKVILAVAAMAAVIMAAAAVGRREKNSGEISEVKQVQAEEESEEKPAEIESLKTDVLENEMKASIELGLIYFAELKDYARSCEILEGVAIQSELAENYLVIIQYLYKGGSENKVKGELAGALEKGREEVEKEAEAQGNAYLYKLPLVCAYSLLNTENAWNEVEEIGNELLKEIIENKYYNYEEKEKEVRGYLGAAYDALGKNEEAISEYVHMKELEEEVGALEQIYLKLENLYMENEEKEAARISSKEAIEKMPESMKMQVMYLRCWLSDSTMDRKLCAQEVKKAVVKMPQLAENAEFLELKNEYEIVIEGENVVVGK